MPITVEISLYPLSETFIPPILNFIDRLKSYTQLDVVTNATSTLITGDYDQIFDVLTKEIKATFQNGKNIFVMKVVSFGRDIHKTR